MTRLEGIPGRVTIKPDRYALDEVFAAAWSGELGGELAKGGGRNVA